MARQARVWPELDLHALEGRVEGRSETQPDATPMSALDEAFAHAIYVAVIRRWLTLRHILTPMITQGFDALEPRVKSALLCGTAQLLLLDRVPAHAAINHAVAWAKAMIRPGAGGLVNAVLRRVATLRDPEQPHRPEFANRRDELLLASGQAVALTTECLPEDPFERLAVVTSHPPSLLAAWNAAASADTTRLRAMHSLVEPPVVLNIRSAASALASTDEHSPIIPHARAGSAVFRGSHAELSSLLASRNDLWVQDSSSAIAVESVRHLAPRRILDLCAGNGTKTRQLERAFTDAQIIATDIDRDRFAQLESTFRSSSRVQARPMVEIRREMVNWADLILLDVPCSNTGVLARRTEARYRYADKTIKSLVDTQRQIIADSIPLLSDRKGAAILYSTCSLEPVENAEQAAWARRWHGFQLSLENVTEPRGLPGDPPVVYHDGAYSILLTR